MTLSDFEVENGHQSCGITFILIEMNKSVEFSEIETNKNHWL